MAAILPYLTIHMKDIGLSLSQIGIIYAVLPFTSFLGPPLLGFMADKLGQYKAVLILATFINGLSHSLLLAVPTYSETPIYSTTLLHLTPSNPPLAILSPANSTLCSSFLSSLKMAQQEESSSSSSLINVHSCNASSTSFQPSPPFTRIVPPFRLPTSCLHSPANSSILCRSRRSGSTPACSISVNLDPTISTPHPVTCLTNFSFPTTVLLTSGNSALTFWLYFLVRIIGTIFMSACFSLLDATTLAIVKLHPNSEYGRERILCVAGTALISPLAGLLVDFVSTSRGYTDYTPAFYVANVMLLLNIILYFFISLSVEKPDSNIWQNCSQLLNYPEVVLFLAMIFIMGNLWGFVESYLFIFLDDLHAPKYLLGLTLTVGSLVSVPFLYGAENMVARVGRVNIIISAFFFYFIRFFGYSYIP